MSVKRKSYSTDFKAKLVLEVLEKYRDQVTTTTQVLSYYTSIKI